MRASIYFVGLDLTDTASLFCARTLLNRRGSLYQLTDDIIVSRILIILVNLRNLRFTCLFVIIKLAYFILVWAYLALIVSSHVEVGIATEDPGLKPEAACIFKVNST